MTSQSRLNPSTTIICTEKNFKGDLATPRSCRLVVVILFALTGKGNEFVVKIFTVCTREQNNGSFELVPVK